MCMPPVLAEAERQALSEGWMVRSEGGRLHLAAEHPSRKQVLLILQVRGMPFSRHDVVELGDQLVGVDSWWAAITQAGGPFEVCCPCRCLCRS